jgi:hypothetical protein
MLRFPYRRIWSEPGPTAAAAPGLLTRFMGFLTGRGTPARPAVPLAAESVPRPFVSIRLRGPIASRRLRSALLDTGSQDMLFPM